MGSIGTFARYEVKGDTRGITCQDKTYQGICHGKRYLCEDSHALVDIHLDCSKSALGEIEPKTSRDNQGMRPLQQKVDSYRRRRVDVSVGWVGQGGFFLGGRRGFANIVC